MITPGLMDQRVRLYEQRDGGADGFTRPVYVCTGEWWGRLDAITETEVVPSAPQSHSAYRMGAVATVADYVPIPLFGVLRVTGEDTVYAVRGWCVVRALRCAKVTLDAIAPAQWQSYELVEDIEVGNGMHLLEAAVPLDHISA